MPNQGLYGVLRISRLMTWTCLQNNLMSILSLMATGYAKNRHVVLFHFVFCMVSAICLKFDKYHVRILLMLSVWTDEGDCLFPLYLLVAQLKAAGHFWLWRWELCGNFQGQSRPSNFLLPNLTALHDRCIPHHNSIRQV